MMDLLPTQLGLLLESQLSGQPDLNILQLVCRFVGETVDPALMQQAWQTLTDRHDALRLSMDPLAVGGPVQEVARYLSVKIAIEDWATAPHADEDAQLARWCDTDRRLGVVVERSPAWRVTLIRLGDDRSVMVWTFHHALLDGTGFRILLADLMAIYDALRAGAPVPVPPPAAPTLADHCRAVAAQDLGPALEQFRRLMAGFDAPNVLDPVFAARGDSGTDLGTGPARRIVGRTLTMTQSAAIHDGAARVGVTAATVMQASWGLVLARASGRGDAVFGLTRSGRHLIPGVEALAGCLINTLPVRVRIGPGLTVADLLQQVRSDTVALHPFEQTPLSRIAGVTDVPPDKRLFDTILMFDRGTVGARLRALGTGWATRDVTELSAMATPMTIAVYDDPEMVIRLEYDPARFDPAGAERLLDYLCSAALALAAAPADTALSRITMLPADETAALLALGTPDAPTPDDAGEQSVIARFEDVAARNPHLTAICQFGPENGPDNALDYRTLDGRANHLAGLLRGRGIGPGDIVGIALPRGSDHVAALLAVLKAEAAFLPLDITYPAVALADMLMRAGADCVMTEGAFAANLDIPGIPVLPMDADASRGLADTGPTRGLHDPERLAYVIYTSGSTGPPKGVAVPHLALSHHATAAMSAFGLTREDVVLQFTSLSFDISVEEILPTLLSGARLVLRDDAAIASVPDFVAALARTGVTVANLPTAYWHVLVAHLDEARGALRLPDHLRLMIAGGERVAPVTLERWRAMYPSVRWLNGYGPTETTITATIYDSDRVPFDGVDVPIGRPFGHARALVLTADGALAPRGVVGELHVGGPAVALGYLHQPELTGRAFVPDNITGQGRLYRTGDRVAWRADGTLSYRGRIDRQVKLRGFRIELSAIEAALESVAEVAHAVVALDQPPGRDPRLLAWVQPRRPGASLDPAEIRAAIARLLPAQMLPAIIPVETFPETPGGKIDLRLLPRPADAVAGPAVADAPADPSTRTVQKIFSELLGMSRIAPDVSFFDLGGHSLLAVRLMSLIERDFGLRLTLAALYQAPTPLGIAAEIARMSRGGGPRAIVHVQPEGQLPPLFAVHILGANASYYRPLAARLGTDQPVIGLTLDLLDPGTPTSLPEIATVYRDAIMTSRPTGPVSLIAVSQGAYVAYELAQQLLAAGREVAGLYILDAAGPGGRPQIARRKSVGGYLHALRTNFPAILRGRYERARMQIGFVVEKQRVILDERLSRREMSAVTLTTHIAALELRIRAYTPQPYPRPITVFRSTDNDADAPAAITSGLGWAPVAVGGVEVIDIPGDHLTVLEEPHVRELALHLGARLATFAVAEKPPESRSA